jgi:hypothetical protein
VRGGYDQYLAGRSSIRPPVSKLKSGSGGGLACVTLSLESSSNKRLTRRVLLEGSRITVLNNQGTTKDGYPQVESMRLLQRMQNGQVATLFARLELPRRLTALNSMQVG